MAGWRRLAPWPFLRLLIAWAGLLAFLFATIGICYGLGLDEARSDEDFLWGADLFVAPVVVAIVALAWMTRGRLARAVTAARARPRTLVAALALLALVFGAAGWRLIFAGYHFSLDEFMADFDARIFAHGQLMAPTPAGWRPYVGAMMPIYTLRSPDYGLWSSSYLPVAAFFRSLFLRFGAESLVNPLWTAISVGMTWAVGRRLWPERPGLALGAAALLATSSQVLITGASAYAMPPHMALNLVWLWLFLRGGRLGHLAAIGVGFLACGLHQLIFHPLFAAPFILQLWLDRRWGAALAYTLSYAAIGLFWVSWWQVLFHLVGAPPFAASAVGGGFFFKRIADLVTAIPDNAAGAMAMGLVRFATWQNPLTAPLLLLAIIPAIRAKGLLRAMAVGVIMTLTAMLILVPSQTHGWGYRYLHGLLGPIALLAAWSWTRLTDVRPGPAKASANAGFALACAASLAVLLPWRAWQAHDYVAPYAAASAAIQSAPEAAVLVDNQEPWIDMGTVVRNDPYLERGPKVILLAAIDEPRLRALCAIGPIGLFDGKQADILGMDNWEDDVFPRVAALRNAMAEMGCGVPVVHP